MNTIKVNAAMIWYDSIELDNIHPIYKGSFPNFVSLLKQFYE